MRQPRLVATFRGSGPRHPGAGVFRVAQLQELCLSLGRDDHVVGTHVTVHDVSSVRLGERVGDLRGELRRASRVERLPGNDAGQRFSGDELGRDVGLSVRDARVEQRREERVRQFGERAELAEETVARGRVERRRHTP